MVVRRASQKSGAEGAGSLGLTKHFNAALMAT
jgi:hypothetical protein